MSFADLKKKRNQDLNALVEAAKNKGFGSREEGYWAPTLGKDDTGYAEVRFLPAHEDDDFPWVQYFLYNFKGPTGQKYVEKSPATIGLEDPVRDYVRSLYATKDKKDAELAKRYKRKLKYVVHVYVIKDAANPDNEGKVFKWRIGPMIFKKLTDAMQPEFEDEKPLNPFCLWTGATFKVKMIKEKDYPNYEKSSFGTPGPLFDDDDKLEAIYKQVQPLGPLIAPDQFKTYDDLEAKFHKVMGWAGRGGAAPAAFAQASAAAEWEDDDDGDAEEEEVVVKPAGKPAAGAEGGIDPLAFFAKVAAGE